MNAPALSNITARLHFLNQRGADLSRRTLTPAAQDEIESISDEMEALSDQLHTLTQGA